MALVQEAQKTCNITCYSPHSSPLRAQSEVASLFYNDDPKQSAAPHSHLAGRMVLLGADPGVGVDLPTVKSSEFKQIAGGRSANATAG